MTKEEYEAKYKANTELEGFGLDTTVHMPCPACAEPDFLVYRVLETETALSRGAVCVHCGVGVRAVFTHALNGTSFEFVQTAGPELPEYLLPMKRVDPETK